MKKLFTEKNFYKGNLHTHTTQSDGSKTPAEAAAFYKDRGYGFIAITDHDFYTQGWDEENFIVLSGMEINKNDFAPHSACHVTAIEPREKPDIEGRSYTVESCIAKMRAKDAFVTIAHPAWSLMHHADLLRLNGYQAIEVYNGISESHAGSRAVSANYIDIAAATGLRPLLTSVDDSHFYTKDVGLGFVAVNAAALSREEIVRALFQGNFYASTGPVIEQIEIGLGKVRVWTRGAARIHFMSDAFWSPLRVVDMQTEGFDGSFTEYTLLEQEAYVRIEVVDENGCCAWSNIIDRADILNA